VFYNVNLSKLFSLILQCQCALTEADVHKLILDTGKKSCPLDPMPTPLMLECLDILLPVITSLINLSLESGQFPNVWKEAIGFD
jgi:hypothetical protein